MGNRKLRAAMSGLLSLIFLFAALATADAQSALETVKSRGTLIAGVRFDTPPYGTVDAAGKNVGIDIEIAQDMAKRLGVKLELVQVTAQSRIPLLTSGKVDLLLAALTHTREREKVVDFSITYILDGVRIMVKKGSSIRGPDDLSGKSVSTVQGSTNIPILKRVAPNARVIEYQEYPQAFLALKQGLADAFVTDLFILDKFAKSDPSFEVVGPYLAPEPIAIGVRKNDSAWRNALNDLLQDMVLDGTWARIVKAHVNVSIPAPEVWPKG